MSSISSAPSSPPPACTTRRASLHTGLTRRPLPPLSLPPLPSSISSLFFLLSLLSLTSPILSLPSLYVSFQAVDISVNSSDLSPSPRCDFVLLPSSTQNAFHLFGGQTVYGPSNDIWTFTPSTSSPFSPSGVWTPATYPSGPWSPRHGHSGSRLPSPILGGTTQELYLYGGVGADGSYLDDIWSLSTNGTAGSSMWTQVRGLSSVKSQPPASPLQIPQPSARGWTSLTGIVLPFTMIEELNRTQLATPNIGAFLATHLSTDAAVAFAVYGGRSDPSTAYAVTMVTGSPMPSGSVGDTSNLDQDYGDLWLYIPTSDVWLLVGNLTCVNHTLICSDYLSMDQLVLNVTSTSVSSLISSLTSLMAQPARPASLDLLVNMMGNYTVIMNNSLDATLVFLQSTNISRYTTNTPNACSLVCALLSEPSPPTVTRSPNCPVGSTEAGCTMYYTLTTSQGVQVSQSRPGRVEGQATASYTAPSDYSVTYQFGGFSCAGQHPGTNVFSYSGYDPSTCLSQTLYVLDTTTSNLVWWAINPPSQASGSQQFLLWPSSRGWASMAIDVVHQQLWLYGGATLSQGRWNFLSDLYIFDLVGIQWIPVTVVGPPPPSARSSALFFHPILPAYNSLNHPYIFGGCSSQGSSNEVYSSTTYAIQQNLDLIASNWLLVGQATTQVTAGIPTSFLAYAVDSPQGQKTLPFAIGLVSQFRFSWTVFDVTGAVINSAPSSPTGNDLGQGVYSFNFTVQQGRVVDLNVFYVARNNTEGPIGNPLRILVQPGPYSPHASTLLYSNYSVVAKGQPTTLTIQLRDAWGNPELSSVGPVLISVTYTASTVNNASALMTALAAVVSDNGDGTFTVEYTAPYVSSYNLYIWVNHVNIQGSPVSVSALDPLNIPASIQVAFVVLCALLGSIIAFLMLGIAVLWSRPAVKVASPLFLELIGLGLLMAIISVSVYAYPTSTTCRLFPFMLTTGYIVCLSALFSKLYRLHAVYKGTTPAVRLSDTTMMGPVIALVLMETLLNLVWLIADPVTLVTYDADTVLPYHQCDGPYATAFIATSVAFNLLCGVCTAWLAFRLRNVGDAGDPTNETKLIAAALYNLILILIIALSLTWTASNTQTSHEDFLIPAAAILWCCAVTAATTLAPRLYFAAYPPAGYLDRGLGGGTKKRVDSGDGAKRRSFEAVGMSLAERAERRRRRQQQEGRKWKETGEAAPPPSRKENEEVELEGIRVSHTLPTPTPQSCLDERLVLCTPNHRASTGEGSEEATPSFNAGRRDSFSARTARPAPITTLGQGLPSPGVGRGGSRSHSRGGGGGGETGTYRTPRDKSVEGSGRVSAGGVRVTSPPVGRGGRASPSSGSPRSSRASGGSMGKRGGGGGGSGKGSGRGRSGSRASIRAVTPSASHEELSQKLHTVQGD